LIHEYLVDPELVLKWASNTRDYSDFMNAFGVGTSRITSGFPKLRTWRKLALQKIPYDDPDSLMAQRAVELVNGITEAQVQRDGFLFRITDEWEENVTREHNRVAFDFVLLHDKRTLQLNNSFKQDDIYEPAKACWNHPIAGVIERRAAHMAGFVGNLLRLSNRIVLVDPYLSVTNAKLDPIVAFIRKALEGRVSETRPSFEVLYDSKRTTQAPSLHAGILRYLEIDPGTINLTVRSLEQRQGGQEIHNRYLLTDLGGITFGHGLDEGSSTDDIALMNKDVYSIRWSEYADCRGFNVFQTYPDPG